MFNWVTADGYFAGPDGNLEWVVPDEAQAKAAAEGRSHGWISLKPSSTSRATPCFATRAGTNANAGSILTLGSLSLERRCRNVRERDQVVVAAAFRLRFSEGIFHAG